MLEFSGYQIVDKIYESASSLVYRALPNRDSLPVILKVLKKDYPTITELTRYRQEYEVTRYLNHSATTCVIGAYGLEEFQNTLVIVVEDFGGESLDRLMGSKGFSVDEALKLAISITESVGEIHGAHVIHKDMNPSNIVLNPATGQLKIIDFGIATRLSRENPATKHPNLLEGTLLYISPEQTGRMNRTIDYRTDYYSMGVTFYELLTGKVPFDSKDSMELVHCHMARRPVSPRELDPEIPKALSDIVMKLMAKTAEQRYQSSRGLIADLKECLRQLEAKGKISDFPLARQDISDRFQIPQKLYGRDREIESLLSAFDRVTAGQSEMILVSGYAGIGKTSLVREIYRPITARRGYFISGKYGQYQRNIPYSALIKAFQELVQQLLSESEDDLNQWRGKLVSALGPNGQVIIDVIPEVEMIVGSQPPVPDLMPSEAQNRFHMVFENFINAFQDPEHPLVIFLDDLQWADAASLKLIELIMTASNSRYLLFIGAYRDNEVDPAHPLVLTLHEIEKSGAIVNHIALSNLEMRYVNQFLTSTLDCGPETTGALAELVLEKTAGNPFFMIEFLKSLYEEELLDFDFDQGAWHWDLAQIEKRGMTDNVVEFMAGKIQRLSSDTQDVLKLAACIGNPFDLHTLAIVYERSQRETATSLEETIEEGLVLPVGDAYRSIVLDMQQASDEWRVEFAFCHDRIQQAAYSLIPNAQRQSVHWQVGQLLLQSTSPDKREQKIFDIVNHLNQGFDPIAHQSERNEIARLNLMAGKKAKASAAYETALNHFKVGLNVLKADSWKKQYDLTLSLYVEAAEAAYVCTLYGEMENLVEMVLGQAKTPLDKARVYEIRLLACTGQNKLKEAVNTAVEAVRLLGIRLPRPRKINILLGSLRTRLALSMKRPEDLVDLPAMTEPHKQAAVRILMKAGQAAYRSAPAMFPLIILKSLNLTLRHGNSPESAIAYATYGVMLSAVSGDIDGAYKYGKLAMSLLERLDIKEFHCTISTYFDMFMRHWKEPIRDILNSFQETYQIGLETGNIEYAATSAFQYLLHSYFAGRELNELQREFSSYGDAIARLKQEIIRNPHAIYEQAVSNLTGETENPCLLVGESCDEDKMVPVLLEANDLTVTFGLYLNKLFLCYLFQEYEQAVKNSDIAETYYVGGRGRANIPFFHFYDSLARLALFPEAKKGEQRSLLRRVSANQKKMRKWANHAPMNHSHKYHLVEAERHRVLGHDSEAMSLYDKAIRLAKENQYLHEEALACELAARFWLDRGNGDIAGLYIKKAHHNYQLWGASRKVKDLEEKYSQLLLQPHGQDADSLLHPSTTPDTHTDSGSKFLDLSSVLKASQAISGEIELASLLKRIMTLVMENAGAEKAFLVLKKGGALAIEARALSGEDMETQMEPVFLEKSHELSSAIVQYVVRTKEDVVLNDAANEGLFTRDPYVLKKQPKSILSIPIIHKADVTGVLYLENNLTTDAFTPDRVEVLRLLSSQAAISIENARFYNRLEESERKYRSLYENTIEGLFQCTVNGRFIGVNPSMARIMGYDSSEGMLSAITDFAAQCYVNPGDAEAFNHRLLEEDQVTGFETQMFRSDGSVFWAYISARAVRNSDGDLLYNEGSLVDITEHKEMEKREREREMAETANRSKSEFLASMSHEIRTPMNAILGMADLLWESPLNQEQKEYVRISRDAGKGLLDLINDILDLSKVEAGQLELEETELDLLDVVERACEIMALRAHEKKLELVSHLAPGTPRCLIGDPSRLHQILVNLIGNAVKFTHEGEIIVRVGGDGGSEAVRDEPHLSGDLGETVEVLFSVRDTGIGIARDLQLKIFESFTQADASTTREFGGTGLGLAICSRLVYMMGGRIWVESQVGQGSTFYFTARFQVLAEPERYVQPPPVDVKGLKTLVVDDNATNRMILREMLSGWAALVSEAEDGERGLAELKRAINTDDPYQLALIDSRMPIMDGFEVVEHLKGELDIPKMTIMMLTSDRRSNDIARCKELGIASYLVKPVKSAMLLEAIISAMGKTKVVHEEVAVTEIAAPEELRALHILLVEDSQDNRLLIQSFLKKTPYKIDIAENGEIAVDKFTSGKYDLVLMDMQMPVMDGYTATKEIRKWEAKEKVEATPIVALTAYATKDEEQKSLDAGCNAHLTKPIKKVKLLEALRIHSQSA